MATLRVADLQAEVGAKVAGVQRVHVAGQDLDVPMFLINGTRTGPTLVVTAGLHGAEYVGIEAALQLARGLRPDELRGRVIVVPVSNMPAFRTRSIWVCPLDGKNVNRMFPGKAHGTASEQLAFWLFENVIKQGDYYVDLHGGDMVESLLPFTIYHASGNQSVDAKSKAMAEIFGIPYVVCNKVVGATYSCAADVGIPGFCAESGEHGLCPPDLVALHTTGLNRLMRYLGMLDGPAPEPIAVTRAKEFAWARSGHDGFWYPAPQLQAGDDVSEGQSLGRVTNLEGETLQDVTSPVTGRLVFLITSLAINGGDPLLGVSA